MSCSAAAGHEGLRRAARWAVVSVALLSVAVAGCDRSASVGTLLGGDGGASVTDGANGFDDPGSGSRTLLVKGLVDATDDGDGATSPDQLEVKLTVQISKAGSPLTGARVTITSAGRTIALSEGDPGHYQGSQSGYVRRYQLDVEAGSDRLSGARLEGPAMHLFSAPRAGESHVPGQPLAVSWQPSGAPLAAIDTRDLPLTTIRDSGSYTVEGRFLQGTSEGDDRVRLRRARRMTLGGAAPGSSFEVGVRNQVSFTVGGG